MGLRRILAVFLVFSLLCPPAVAQASDLDRQTIAIVELYHPESSSILTRRAADRIRHELEQDGRFEVLSKRKTLQGLASLNQKEGTGGLNLGNVVREAQDRYNNLELELAEASLRKSLDKFRRGGEVGLEDAASLVPAWLLLGVISNAEGQTARALAAFEEAARLSPEMALTERDYSPSAINLFNQAKQKVHRDQFAMVSVKSSPAKAKVYLNGKLKGETPLQLKGLPPGRQYLVLVREGYANLSHTVNVSPGLPASLSLELGKEEGSETAAAGLTVSSLDDSDEILREASLAGQWLNADRLVLVHGEEINGAGKITAAVMEMLRPDAFSQRSVNLTDTGDHGRDLISAVGTLAAYVVEFGASGAVAEGRPMEPLRSKHHRDRETTGGRPLWKRPLFWIIGGLVLAGAGAGVGIAMSGGGGGGGNADVSIEIPPAPGLGAR